MLYTNKKQFMSLNCYKQSKLMNISSQNLSSVQKSPLSPETEAHWFPHQMPNHTEMAISLSLREQKVEFEEKLINVRQEIVKLHQEVLGLKELLMKVVEDQNKIRPILDDRKRNELLRRHRPFPFIAEHSAQTSDVRLIGNNDKKD
jgi:hypothetical protein